MKPAAELRAWWSHRQGLSSSPDGGSLQSALLTSGWARSVGGTNPYLTGHARTGCSVVHAHQELKDRLVLELPAARGCTYVLPRQEFSLGLALASRAVKNDLGPARRISDISDSEVESLTEALVTLLSDTPQSPAALRAQLGDKVREFGPEGKKVGLTTSLSLALGRAQRRGLALRWPDSGRFDTQKYSYVRVQIPEFLGDPLVALAERYFQWMGPATLAQFQEFAGSSATAARAAVTSLNLCEIGNGLLLPAELKAEYEDFSRPKSPEYRLVSAMDSLILHRRDVASLVGDTSGLPVPVQIGGLQVLNANAILDRGEIVGLWEFDPGAGDIAWFSWAPVSVALIDAVTRTQQFILNELGDARLFSLDSPASRAGRIASLRSGTLA